jgi:hypothetical protein
MEDLKMGAGEAKVSPTWGDPIAIGLEGAKPEEFLK